MLKAKTAPPRHTSPLAFCSIRDWVRVSRHMRRSFVSELAFVVLALATAGLALVSQQQFLGVDAATTSGYLSAPDGSRQCICDGQEPTFDASIDRFASTGKVFPNYSKQWNVTYHKYYKRIEVLLDGYSGEKAVIYAYICGAPRLSVSQKQQLFGDNTHTEIKYNVDADIPFRSVALFSTTFVPHVEYIGEALSVVHLNANQTTFSPCIKKLYELGKTTDTTYSTLATILANNPRPNLDGIFMDSFGWTAAYGYGFSDEVNTLAATGSNAALIPVTAFNEANYLAVAEWVEFFSMFYNREIAAANVLDNINLRFTCTADAVSKNKTSSPKVLIGSGGKWGYGTMVCPKWQCHMITNAGGSIIEYNSTYTVNDTYFVQEIVSKADVWIYTDGNWNASTQYNTPYLPSRLDLIKDTNVYKNKMIFDITKDSLFEWFEAAQAEPDVLLRDFVDAIFPGKNLAGPHNRVFLRNVFNETSFLGYESSANCPDPSKAKFTDWITTGCAIEGIPDVPVVIPGVGGDSGVTFPSCSNPTATPTPKPTKSVKDSDASKAPMGFAVATTVLAIMISLIA